MDSIDSQKIGIPRTDGHFHTIETIDTTDMCYSNAKPLIEELVVKYMDMGYTVKVQARSFVDIMLLNDS